LARRTVGWRASINRTRARRPMVTPPHWWVPSCRRSFEHRCHLPPTSISHRHSWSAFGIRSAMALLT
jgi:hypothetical protein